MTEFSDYSKVFGSSKILALYRHGWESSLYYYDVFYLNPQSKDRHLLKRCRLKFKRSGVQTRFFQLTDEEVQSMILPRII